VLSLLRTVHIFKGRNLDICNAEDDTLPGKTGSDKPVSLRHSPTEFSATALRKPQNSQSLGYFEGFNRCPLSLLLGIVLHRTVSSVPSGSSDVHMKSGT
jgi:hypothetical protein